MQFDVEGQIVRRVRWYFVPENTPWLPVPHQFGSHIWAWNGYFPPGLGERWDSIQTYRKGDIPWRIDTPSKFCGDPTWWDEGVPSDAPDLVLSPIGQPNCCIDGSGIRVGGISTVSYREPLKGGIRVGGESYVWPVLYGTGGVRPGATLSTVLRGYYFGGVLVGGRGIPIVPYPVSGGLLLGGLPRSYLRTVSEGGIRPGGLTSEALIAPVRGGLLVGGLSSDSLTCNVRGGVFVGGDSTHTLVALTSGGVRVGALFAAECTAEVQGGVKVGATSVEQLVEVVHGGVKVGATSVESLVEVVHGGVKVGALSSVYFGGVSTCCGGLTLANGLHFIHVPGNSGVTYYGNWTTPTTGRGHSLITYNAGVNANTFFRIGNCDGTPCTTLYLSFNAPAKKGTTTSTTVNSQFNLSTQNLTGPSVYVPIWVIWDIASSITVGTTCATATAFPYFPGWVMLVGGITQFYSFSPTISDTYTFKTYSAAYTNTLTIFDSSCTTTLATGAGNTGFSVALTAGVTYKLRMQGSTTHVPLSISAPSYPSWYLWE